MAGLARAAGVSRTYWWEVERGGHSPTVEVLRKMAGAMGVGVCEILCDGIPFEVGGKWWRQRVDGRMVKLERVCAGGWELVMKGGFGVVAGVEPEAVPVECVVGLLRAMEVV